MRGDGFWFENSPARKALFICEATVNDKKIFFILQIYLHNVTYIYNYKEKININLITAKAVIRGPLSSQSGVGEPFYLAWFIFTIVGALIGAFYVSSKKQQS